VEDQYLARNGRELVATLKGITLIDQLAEIGAEVEAAHAVTLQIRRNG